MEAEKRRIRQRVRAERLSRSPAAREAAGEALTAQLSDLVESTGARTLTCFVAIGGEPDTSGFLSWASARHLLVLLPSARDDGGLDWFPDDGERRASGAFGIPHPVGEPITPRALEEVDLMLIPACAVDDAGTRLGWGRGYFDRALAAFPTPPPTFAVVYDEEVLPPLPAEPHDMPVDGIVTPTGWRRVQHRR